MDEEEEEEEDPWRPLDPHDPGNKHTASRPFRKGGSASQPASQ